MAMWIPIALIAGTVLGVYSQTRDPKAAVASSCGKLSPEERTSLDRFLGADPAAILAVGRAANIDKAMLVSSIHTSASELDKLGCTTDGDRVRAKADLVSRLVEPPVHAALPPSTGQDLGGPWLRQQGGQVSSSSDLTGAYVAPEVRVAGTAEPTSPTTLHGVAPGTSARLDQAYGQAFGGGSSFDPLGAAPSAGPRTPPPIALMRTKARVAIRPEPVAWNDEAMGKLGFTVPAGYPVGVLAFGPPTCPPGWSKVELQHPDHGVVDGFTEAANLTLPDAASATPAQAQTSGMKKPVAAAAVAQSFQGRSRSRGKAQAKTKRSAPRTA